MSLYSHSYRQRRNSLAHATWDVLAHSGDVIMVMMMSLCHLGVAYCSTLGLILSLSLRASLGLSLSSRLLCLRSHCCLVSYSSVHKIDSYSIACYYSGLSIYCGISSLLTSAPWEVTFSFQSRSTSPDPRLSRRTGRSDNQPFLISDTR
jgi:amino acid permease